MSNIDLGRKSDLKPFNNK